MSRNPDQQAPKPWHALAGEEAVSRLTTDIETGLDEAEATRRRGQCGENRLTPQKGRGPVVRFLLQFHQPLVYILLAATVVTLALQEWVDAGVIFAVVLLNAIVGFIQESKALNAIDALSKSLVSENTVLRNGRRVTVASADLVPGDVVLLQSGDKVPADLRIVRCRDLQVDESALTGESVPSQKDPAKLAANQALADRANMAYSSTLVTYGTGVGIVSETGDRTEIGRISRMIAGTQMLETPLTRRIAQFSQYLLYAILALAAAALVLGAVQGRPLIDSFMASVALAVAAIPEGLPAAVTIMLAIGVARMARRRAIIRRLPAVETLGSTTMVCSDKTGTLTRNQMTVQAIETVDGAFEVSGAGYAPEGEIRPAGSAGLDSPALAATLECGVLCNNAAIGLKEELWRVDGDPTEGALLCAAAKSGLERDAMTRAMPRRDELPFESAHQYMATLHEHEDGGRVAYLKGAVEALLPRCRSALSASGDLVPVDAQALEAKAADMASRGLRVLAFARLGEHAAETLSHDSVSDGLTFLGLQGMIDPPRPEAVDAVAACRTAGIGVKMITGDHALTAATIARRLGLIQASTEDAEAVVTGRELDGMSDVQLAEAAARASVFARVTPDNKYRLVEALQGQGHVVAMTGDGVNDAPALKRADIGVAMALGGTEVAREAADMMLTDDNFATIKAAIEEGRGIFDNLKKFIVWTLPTNGGEGLVILLAIMLGIALPILPVQILWINMTTAILLGLMLAFEPKERDIMVRSPHSPKAALIDGALILRIVLVSLLLCAGAFGLYEWELAAGASEAQARTVAVAVFVVGEAFYLLNCRSLTRSVFAVGLGTNPWIWAGIGAMAALQLAFTYLPVMNIWFDSAPIGVDAWLRVVAWGLVIFTAVGIEKSWRRYRAPLAVRKAAA